MNNITQGNNKQQHRMPLPKLRVLVNTSKMKAHGASYGSYSQATPATATATPATPQTATAKVLTFTCQ